MILQVEPCWIPTFHADVLTTSLKLQKTPWFSRCFHDVSWVYSIRSPTYPPKILVASTSWIPLPHVATLLSQELKASCRKNLTKSEIQRAEGLKVEDWSSTISCSWTYPEIPNCAVLFRGFHWSLLYSADLYAENALVVWYGLARSKHLLRLYLELFFGV